MSTILEVIELLCLHLFIRSYFFVLALLDHQYIEQALIRIGHKIGNIRPKGKR